MGAMRGSLPGLPPLPAAPRPSAWANAALPWWDLHAPVVPAGEGERHFSFAEAEEFIDQQFASSRATWPAWPGRPLASAGSTPSRAPASAAAPSACGLPGVRESRVLCNFDGSLDQLFTIAHELGHAYHNFCLREQAAAADARRP